MFSTDGVPDVGVPDVPTQWVGRAVRPTPARTGKGPVPACVPVRALSLCGGVPVSVGCQPVGSSTKTGISRSVFVW